MGDTVYTSSNRGIRCMSDTVHASYTNVLSPDAKWRPHRKGEYFKDSIHDSSFDMISCEPSCEPKDSHPF